MSLRNFVPSYPQLSVNGPPPHHQTHRVQALPVSVATALQQQISQQQQQQQTQQGGSSQSNPNGNGSGNVQASSHDAYHVAPCLQFQAPAGANIAPNFIRHMSNGAYQAHPQNPYQTQVPPPQAQQPTNPPQSLTNSAPSQQGRLTTMAPPTAPPTPPTQQQQQQTPQTAPYAVQQGAATGHRNAQQYPRPQQQVPRRTQQQTPQTYMYQTTAFPQSFLPQFIPSGHIRAQPMQLPHQFSSQVYQPMATPLYFNPQAPAFQQITAPTTNGQRQTATPTTVPPTSMGPAANEYPSYNVYDMPPVIQQPATTQPPPQKTTKKPGSFAIKIINPNTGKDIFDEDGNGAVTTSGSVSSSNSNNNISSSNSSINNSISSGVDDKVSSNVTEHHLHHHSGKEESVEKENAEPLTPVVSAMSDGPSVDITPKHQVNKVKKIKPPEQIPSQQQQQSQSLSVQNSNQSSQPSMVVPQLADPPKHIKIEAPKQEIPEQQQQQQQQVIITSQPVQDSENNNSSTIEQVQETIETELIVSSPAPSQSTTAAVEVNEVNDTNNNSYQTKDDEPNENEVLNEPNESDETDRAVVMEPQDTNNNNSTETDEKIAPVDGPINYDEDQWSPANLSGKKYYTRDQLLKLKDAVMVPPIRLPDGVAGQLSKNNKEYLTNTLTQVMPPMGMRTPYDAINSVAPKFMMNTPGNRNPYQTKRPSQQGNQQKVPGRGGSQTGPDRQILKINLSLHDDVKLNESENAWKPTHLKKNDNLSEEEKTTNETLSKFRSMLNKLTAENFGVLVEQVRTFKIDTSERLDGVINLLFEKAISEPKFAPTYAQLCNEIANIQTVSTGTGLQDQVQDKQAKKNTLKVRLITQCQKEFERNKEDTIKFREIEEKLRENESETDNEKREETKAALEEEHYKLRQRANGTVKFIGELFKIDMLTSKIMRTCIEMLLYNEPTEEKVERVCKLLTTIGGKMEANEGRQSLSKYFHLLNEMTQSNNKVVRSSRIKFEIQNLQDLRNSGWKARRQETTPKTMDQLQYEADQEQQLINYHTRQSVKEERQRGGQGYNKRQQPQQDSDGWSVQQNSKSRATPIQLKNISLPSMSDSSAKLGQASQFQNFMMQTNKFAGLAVDGENEPPRFGSGSKNSSMERGNPSSRFYGNGADNRYGGRGSSNQNSRNSSQIRSRDNSDTRGGPSRSLQAPPRHQQQQPMGGASMSFSGPAPVKKQSPTPVTLTEEEIEKFLKELVSIVDAYRDDKLTIEGVTEKANKVSINKDVLEQIYNKFLDRKDKDRENLMLVIVELIKQKMVMRDDNKQALLKVMEFAPDIQCDVPRVYEYIAQFMSELLIANVLTFQEVYQICQAEARNQENILRFIFTAIEKRHSANKLQQVVAESNCDLGQFVRDGNFGRWLEENKFTNMVRRGTRGIGDVMKHLEEMLQQKTSNDNIMDYIKSTNVANDPSFIRQLTLVVMTYCCDEYAAGQPQASYKLNNAKLEQLSLILQRYIDTEIERELQCIFALQHFAFIREYPPGLLNSIFEVLYDNDVLSVEAFEKWKNSEDACEGKGVAVCSTRQFFTKLAEDEDDDDDTGSSRWLAGWVSHNSTTTFSGLFEHLQSSKNSSKVKGSKKPTSLPFRKRFLNFFVATGVPYAAIAHKSFAAMFDHEKVPSTKTLRADVDSENVQMLIDIKNILKKVDFVCLTADSWSSYNRNFIAVTCLLFDHKTHDKFSKKRLLLAIKQVSKSIDFELIANFLDETINKFNLKNKVRKVITDGGSNFIKAFK
ncbi:hypothetical protein PVAND_014436 [Polypedilum vanderplanki]|uniref:Eukaryotic translation initiation factor 4 gamma n=1 Tax=Polypedilum vanderplanki TaxID=319348 RepID=A0A9J6B9S0_POLVA|nr:hypothetical protein PVAND_014436 [Polypedilum vanderplanki]